jgi:hypothetical protein
MAHLVGGRDYISRAELAQFVMDQFNLFTNVRIALFQHLASTDSPGPVISDHGCKRVAKSRMEAWRSPQCVQRQEHIPGVLMEPRSLCMAAGLPCPETALEYQEKLS